MATLPRPSPTVASPSAREDFHAQQGRRADPAALSTWASESISVRLAWVAAFRRLIAANSATLDSIIRDEIGKSSWEAFSGDILPLLAACRWHERKARRLLAPRALVGGPVWLVGNRQAVRRAPLGRVGIIATWNYPVQLLGIQLVQALVAGNDVVVKPSERSPRSQAYLVKLAQAAGLPPGTLELRDHAREAGQRMLETERFDKLVFTGSTRVGRCIAAMAAETLTPTALELSGCDSALVLDDADVGLAARVIWNAAIMNAGQTCMAPRRALVDARVYRDFLAAMSPLAAGAKPVTLADEAGARHTFSLAQQSLAHGARSLSGVLEPPSGRRLRPLAMADCPIGAPLACVEHFGPALAIVPVAGLDAMLAAHDSISQRLATSVFTAAPARARAVADRLGSATVTINDCILPSSHPGAGISGRGPSGWGTTRGPDGLLAMTRPVQIGTTSTTRRLPPEPPPPAQAAYIRRAMLWWYGGGPKQQTIAPD